MESTLVADPLPQCLELKFIGNETLAGWLKRFQWMRRENPEQLEQEVKALLFRLTKAEQIDLSPLPAGQSGAGLLLVHPYRDSREEAPFVVKIGKKGKIRREQENYTRFVAPYINAFSLKLGYALVQVIGMLAYQLIGPRLDELNSFADYYLDSEPGHIYQALDDLFRDTCNRWYINREQPRRRRNLVGLYTEGLNIKWPEVWDRARALKIDLSARQLRFPDLRGTFTNPKGWLESQNYAIYLPVWRAMTHGDLNENNILITKDGRCWLIDFYRTGWGHILRDIIELETAIKFNLTVTESLAQYQQLEAQLLGQTRLDRPFVPATSHPDYKALAVIGYLRRLADTLTGGVPAMTEYNVGLLLTTLNLLRFDFMGSQHGQIWLSAAMLCHHLSHSSIRLWDDSQHRPELQRVGLAWPE